MEPTIWFYLNFWQSDEWLYKSTPWKLLFQKRHIDSW